MCNSGKKPTKDLVVPLAKDVLPKSVTKATLPILYKFKRKISGEGAVWAGTGFTLLIPNVDMYDIIKITVTRKFTSIDWWC